MGMEQGVCAARRKQGGGKRTRGGWREVLDRSWNSKRPLGVLRAQEIRARLIRRMDLWERGLHAELVGDTKAEGADREGRDASNREEKDEAVAWSFHNIVLFGKL